jgi:small-conductance mechanosensitive channel/CRP-like cAMP-binding protein
MNPLPYIVLAVLVAVRLWLVPYAIGHEPKAYSDLLDRAVNIAIIVAVAAILDGMIRQFYWHGHLKRRRNRETPALIQDIVTVTLLLLGLALGFWWQAGLTLTGIAAASGAVAFVLGIALQPVIQDLFSGLSINFDGSYTLGEWITVYSDQMPEPAYGRVTGINWRTTFITTEDGRRIMVPNRLITSNPVANHSRAPAAKEMWLEVEVEIRVPQERVMDMILGEVMKAVHAPGLVRHPAPELLVNKLTADAAVYEIRFSYNPDEITPGHAKSIVLRAVHEAIQKNDVPLPVTQVELTQPPNLEFPFGAKEIREALCGVPLFRDALDEQQLELLGSQCRLKEFPAGAVLMRQGDAAASMYVITEGAAAITLTTPDGVLHEVAASAAGDVAGEMSLMTGAARTATVTAATRVRALEITRDDIKQLLDREPELYERFTATLARRQRELDAIAQRHADAQQVETDILARMKAFFSRSFGMS